MDGILIVDKPEGITSAGVVRQVKRLCKAKTGHLGTLDPFASGVLPLCLGQGTKIAPFLNQADKEYVGVIRLGARTDSGDRTGEVVEEKAVPDDLGGAALADVGRRFLGPQAQVPPMYSAVKRDGQPLYKLARQGVTVEREPRTIHVHELELADQGAGRVSFRALCSKGTYVRVLAEEIGASLGTVAHVEALRRTLFGSFRIDQALPLDDVETGAAEALVGLDEALAEIDSVTLNAAEMARARQGFEPLLARLPLPEEGEAAKLLGPDGTLAAVVTREPGRGWRYARVFAGV